MQDRDDLQSVQQRLDLIRRKVDVARWQRPRRKLVRPVRRLRQYDGYGAAEAQSTQGHAQSQFAKERSHFVSDSDRTDGNNVSTVRLFVVKYVRATRWTSAGV